MDTPRRRYLDLEELSRVSGLSQVTLRRYWRDGKIHGFQPGGPGSRVLFPADALERSPNLPGDPEETRATVSKTAPATPLGQAVPDRTLALAAVRTRARWRRNLNSNLDPKSME
jgi:hypothetical protein